MELVMDIIHIIHNQNYFLFTDLILSSNLQITVVP